MMVLGSGPRMRSRAEPIVRASTNSGSRAGVPKGPAPFRSPPRDAFFSIEGSRIRRDNNQVQTRPNSRLYDDPLQDYFPSISLDHDSPLDFEIPSRSHSRSESVPIPNADSFEASDADTATRSTTAPPYVDLSLTLSDLVNLDMSVNDIATVGIEKEQEKFKVERRLTISSAMGARQHGSPHPGSLGGVTTRRKRLEREHAYLRMKFRERPCLRTESFLNQDLADEVNDMSRECCDVLGPKSCHECDRLNRRSNSALRNEANFPSLHISAANFSTMTMVNQVRPDLSAREVLERLARGDITRPRSLRHRKGTSKTGEDDKDDDDKSSKRKISISAFSVPDGQGYFTNFTDLRAQIFARQGKNHTRGKRFNSTQNVSNLPVITNVELIPKKEYERENPANYFGPPMMSREEIKRQQSQPRFYAGAQGKYELPEAPSIDEIVRQATGARHQKLRQLEPRSDTPDSDISLRSLKSPLPDENLNVDPGKIDARKSNVDVNANEETNLLE